MNIINTGDVFVSISISTIKINSTQNMGKQVKIKIIKNYQIWANKWDSKMCYQVWRIGNNKSN